MYRRRLLRAAWAGSVAAIAGCGSSGQPETVTLGLGERYEYEGGYLTVEKFEEPMAIVAYVRAGVTYQWGIEEREIVQFDGGGPRIRMTEIDVDTGTITFEVLEKRY